MLRWVCGWRGTRAGLTLVTGRELKPHLGYVSVRLILEL